MTVNVLDGESPAILTQMRSSGTVLLSYLCIFSIMKDGIVMS